LQLLPTFDGTKFIPRRRFQPVGNLGWSKVGQRKLRGFFWKQDVATLVRAWQAAVCKLRDNF